MIPPLVTLMASTPAVTAVLGTNPTRFFLSNLPESFALSAGDAYATYRVVSGLPSNYQSGAPVVDNSRVQIDVYCTVASTANAAYEAIRDAVETVSHIVSFNIGGDFDEVSKTYRYSFDISYWLRR